MQGGLPLQVAGQLEPDGSRAELFGSIFEVFLVLGTIVGVVVIGYMLYNAYRYRDDGTGAAADDEVERPELGELPEGGGHGRKLLLSFSLSAIIVISLILWTYWALLYVEAGAAQPANPEMADGTTVDVTGYRFGWRFAYPNGNTTEGTMYVPADERVRLVVTSDDVMHNFGIPALDTKTDAIPGQTTSTWFGPVEEGQTFTAKCYELCGEGHSFMTATVRVIDADEYERRFVEETNATSDGSERVATPPAAAPGAGAGQSVDAPTAAASLPTPAARPRTAASTEVLAVHD